MSHCIIEFGGGFRLLSGAGGSTGVSPHLDMLIVAGDLFPERDSLQLVWRDISLWTVIEKINANRDCTLGLLMVSPAQRVGAYV